jgi:hypothetical protein
MPWRLFEYRAKRRNKSERSIASVNNWSKRVSVWKPKGAVSWSITGWNQPRIGGSRALLPRSRSQSWMKELLCNSQPILVALQEKIRTLTQQLQGAAGPGQARGFGALGSVVIDREIGNWTRFNNRRQVGSYTGLCPGEYSSGNTRLQSCVTKHGNPRLRAALVETAWRLVRFQPNYKPVRKWRQTLAKGALATKAARKKAIVAVARQLAVDLWRIRTGRVTAEQMDFSI